MDSHFRGNDIGVENPVCKFCSPVIYQRTIFYGAVYYTGGDQGTNSSGEENWLPVDFTMHCSSVISQREELW